MIRKYSFLLLGAFISMSVIGLCMAEEGIEERVSAEELSLSVNPDPEFALHSQEELEGLEGHIIGEPLIIEESENLGYWWIKQDYSTKSEYVKNLKQLFSKEDVVVTMTLREIVKELDEFYNPVDNPMDIKMDKSIERAFITIIKGDD